MDGNGRWAQERGMPRTMGHKNALKTLKELCIHMADVGVRYASLYAFSTENFKREQSEVDYLMELFMISFQKEYAFLKEKHVRVVFSGRREPLPQKVLDAMDKIVEETKDNQKLVLNICINYGSHAEIVDCMKETSEKVRNGEIGLEDITEDYIQHHLYQDLPPLDFVIRTSGELRLSNFMMYQASYAEFYFPKVYFPDFTVEEFDKAILEYNHRNRRFGGVKS
jgi:undecaprenyl diphosphate synthase